MPMENSLRVELAKEAERIEEDAIFSGKAHYNSVALWRCVYRILGIVAATGSAFAALAVLKGWSPNLAIGGAAAATLASVVLTSLKPGEEADRHQRAGDRYLSLKNRARIFRQIEIATEGSHEMDLTATVKSLSDCLADIRSGAPVIPDRSYKRAKTQIESEKATTYQVDRP